ncbi:MAG: UDP-N-acetylmuramate dehydrogenase [Bacteroidia bacterium]|nr:UDP-N-acetylmuramate dehydrogenase [Bacteroidia bacterium]NNF30379.1 UDP-N-acetylmuramate dehydrogenase [Flavobacteriaceae bacterium]MBT8276455.1 UDP-N-acetylmuramate dehydrogenase [Bacteroidia bacterium]NNJ80711.1 UDP-N-acetylmuramate dehydrogenase [Flavobacteriaceae bacterium]NNK53476.1 UDP-N-acetylmuramate dehydrogenase [Flavobacteriaceae bacterium]
MFIEKNKSLRNYNTFGIDVTARAFVSVESLEDLRTILKDYTPDEVFILGGGSNMLLTAPIDKLVVHINLKGIEVLSRTEDEVILEIQAGENWHELVMYCIENDFGGIENLSLIPGNTGTAPIQNIGAYGVELEDVFESCTAIECTTGVLRSFSREECKFGYRNSIFKDEAKDQYIITSVMLRLTSKNHKINSSYGAISDVLAKRNIENPTIKDISEAVISIRRSKLPDPAEIGNSGSFFKNPVLSSEEFKKFRSKNPEAPYYEVSATQFKIPAGWLIDQAGFKGKRYGDAGIHKHQALVLVNHGNASGSEIWNLALKIQKKVKEDFGIYIEPEVNVI